MATKAQLNANRCNAQKSTGPTTAEGKSRSSRNATQHGLLSATPNLPGEDPAAFEGFLHAVLADQQPAGAVQTMLVERIAHLQWKLKRLPQIEASIITSQADAETTRRNPPSYSRRPNPHVPGPGTAETISMDVRGRNVLGTLQVYEQRLERSLRACLKELRELRKDSVEIDEENVGSALADHGVEDGPPRRTLQEADHAATDVADSDSSRTNEPNFENTESTTPVAGSSNQSASVASEDEPNKRTQSAANPCRGRELALPPAPGAAYDDRAKTSPDVQRDAGEQAHTTGGTP